MPKPGEMIQVKCDPDVHLWWPFFKKDFMHSEPTHQPLGSNPFIPKLVRLKTKQEVRILYTHEHSEVDGVSGNSSSIGIVSSCDVDFGVASVQCNGQSDFLAQQFMS